MKKGDSPSEFAQDLNPLNSSSVKKKVEKATDSSKETEMITEETRRRIFNIAKQKKSGEMTWIELVSELKTKTDFLLYFESQNINEGQWESSVWIKENFSDRFYDSLISDPRFKKGGWKEFRRFMGKEKIGSKIAECETSTDFLNLFDELKIPEGMWKNSGWLSKNNFGYVYAAIVKDIRFKKGGWNSFLEFMDCKKETPITEQVAKCKTIEDFLSLFKKLKIPGEKWKNSMWLSSNGFSSVRTSIVNDSRFVEGGWYSFLEFMDCKKETPMTEQVAKCKTIEDFLSLFKKLKIPGEKWKSSRWLQQNNLGRLYDAITNDNRFSNQWNQFLKFMDCERTSMEERITKCITTDDFLKLFLHLKIINDNWKNSSWLTDNGFAVLYRTIRDDPRFIKNGWSDFLLFMDAESIKSDNEFEKLSSLKLEESIALLRYDPLKLKRFMQFAYRELSEKEIDSLVLCSFKGLREKGDTSEAKYLKWKEDLNEPSLEKEPIKKTAENTVTIRGTAPGATHIFIAGAYTRRKKLGDDGSYEIFVPLKIGEYNSIRVMSINTDTTMRSEQLDFGVRQLGEPDDIDALVKLLSALGDDVRNGIQKDPGRNKYLCECMEQALIKKFGRSFPEGVKYIEGLRAKHDTSPMMNKVLTIVLKKFKDIHDSEIPGVIDGSLLFFQKYCAYEIRRRINEGLPGVILANDPGTGKTRVVQSATADKHTTVITPNSVVSAWEEESGRVLESIDVVALRDLHSDVRKQILRTRGAARSALVPQHTYINREFLRATSDNERFELLSDKQTILVHDEAHSRTNETSEQSKGAKKLQSQFQILVSATPFKNPKTFRRMMAILKPNDERFKNDAAFVKAFPQSDPQALKTLSLLKNDVTLRFRKEDVMETVDPNQSLEQQKHKLPIKEFIDQKKHGRFTISMAQAESLYQIFVNWPEWCRQNNQYIPKDNIARQDGLRTSDGFARTHAFRQTVNNPAYINAKVADGKLEEMRSIIEKCMKEGRKVVVFCTYEAQAVKYAEAFASLQPALYIGKTSGKGDMKNESNKPRKFKKGDTGNGQHGWIFDKKGYPIDDLEGHPMSALDYERITFQNVAARKLLISTYSAGAVGTTFTAGKALIEDDLPVDCIEEIQAEDRIHRIDPARMTHATVKYYRMISAYPEKFIEEVKKRWLVKENRHYKEFSNKKNAEVYAQSESRKTGTEIKVENAYELFFAQGTYDEVQEKNLQTQRTMFRLINDGIADESIIKDEEKPFVGLENGSTKD